MGVGAGGHQRAVLLTLGRLPVSLELARAFAAEGWRVVVVDSMQWHLCRASNAVSQCIKVPSPKKAPKAYESALLSVVKEQQIDCVVPVSEEAAYVTKLKNRLPAHVQLVAVAHEQWLNLHDKHIAMQQCKQAGLAVPDTQLLSERLALEKQASQSLVIKKRLTAAGTGLQFVEPPAPLPILENPNDWVVQPRLYGDELCVFSVYNNGSCQLQTAYKALLVDGTVSVAFERCDLPSSLSTWLQHFGDVTGYHGMASFDFMQNAHGEWCALECNPRATSGLHFTDAKQLVEALTQGGVGSESVRSASVSSATSSRSTFSGPNAQLPAQQPAQQPALLMEFWSCFTLAFSANNRRKIRYGSEVGLRALFQCMRRCQDISWSSQDRWPFLLMPLLSAPLLWLSIRHKQSFATSAVADISWPPNQQDDDDA